MLAEQLAIPTEPDLCQRWRTRAPTWRRRAEGGFNADLYRVVPLAERSAKRFVLTHHYSRSWPSVSLAYGLQRLDQPPTHPDDPEGGALVGVVALGVPMNEAVLTGVFPTLAPYREALELSRLVLLDTEPSNAESWACSRVFGLAAQAGIRGVIAYADPVPRTRITAQGPQQLTPGHVGHVYHAQDFSYLGRGRARRLTLLPDATVLQDRAANKVRRGEPGAAGVIRRLRQYGAPAPGPGESGPYWLAKALTAIGATTVRHPGNHRWARSIGPHRTRVHLGAAVLPRPERTAH
ncbi:hypothetical protein [Streptomyces sp. G-5]|uniref:Mom family adenine methylcarbamoylation protein n=1 Tax=Streptomyces sp. G-5 TaxID=2977231 RepID=UPI0021D0E298|nr:hypothetical protein [Streptomyces sp. G-5]MCU4750214.1 hypothetical protein [Streptomyces sp. G-5]